MLQRNIMIILVIGVLSSGCVSQYTESFYIEHAKFAQFETHSKLRQTPMHDENIDDIEFFALVGHRIDHGNGTILGIREYSSGPLLTVDQGGFRKVTIWIPNPILVVGETRLASTYQAIAFASVGNPSFPDRGCWAYASSGKIFAHKKYEKLALIEFDIPFPKLQPDCQSFHLLKSIVVKEKDIDTLTPWEGAVGRTIFDEGIRRQQ